MALVFGNYGIQSLAQDPVKGGEWLKHLATCNNKPVWPTMPDKSTFWVTPFSQFQSRYPNAPRCTYAGVITFHGSSWREPFSHLTIESSKTLSLPLISSTPFFFQTPSSAVGLSSITFPPRAEGGAQLRTSSVSPPGGWRTTGGRRRSVEERKGVTIYCLSCVRTCREDSKSQQVRNTMKHPNHHMFGINCMHLMLIRSNMIK